RGWRSWLPRRIGDSARPSAARALGSGWDIIKASDGGNYATRFFGKYNSAHRFACARSRRFAGRERVDLRVKSPVERRQRKGMTSVTESELREHLTSFVVPQTGRPLGGAGTALT